MKIASFAIHFFKLLCIGTAAFMVVFWIVKFQKNDDLSVIEYKAFKDFEKIFYPELTLCFDGKTIMNQKWINVSQGINKDDYFRYLGGKMPANETYNKIPYLDSSLNIFEFVETIWVAWNDKSIPVTVCSNEHDCSFLISNNSFNGYLDPAWTKGFCKCFGFSINTSYAHNISKIRKDII